MTGAAPQAVEEEGVAIQPHHYVYIDNLRLVQPYFYDFKCFVKKRWEGRRLVDVFSEEFPLLTMEYYERAFNAGRLRVESSAGKPLSGPPMTLDSPVRVGMCVRHLVHRHEPPVPAAPVQVLHVNSEWVAVVKPACMPVHTVGQYRKNTVLGVLSCDHPHLGTLYPTYRLDRPVSGLLVLARSAAAASRMRSALEERNCEKLYVARVQGRFPATQEELVSSCPPAASRPHVRCVPVDQWPQPAPDTATHASVTLTGGTSEAAVVVECDVPLSYNPQTNHATAVPDSDAPTTSQPSTAAIQDDSGGQTGASKATQSSRSAPDLTPRTACTQFRLVRVSADGQSSVVACRPLTGRTHQIRVHLEYLGFPIANDTQYGGTQGKPLAFRRLRQAKHLQDQSAPAPPHTPTPQQPAGTVTPADAPAEHSQPQPQPQVEQPASSHPAAAGVTHANGTAALKRPRNTDGHNGTGSDNGAVDDQGQTGGASAGPGPDSATETAKSKRQALVTAFINPAVLQGSVLYNMAQQQAHGTQGPGSSAQGPVGSEPGGQQGAMQPEVHAGSGAAASGGEGATDVGASTGGEPLPAEIVKLYLDPRYRVTPEQEEEGYPIDLQSLWLHAIRYKCADWDFTAPMPDWAED